MPWSSLLGNIREYAIFTLDEHGRFDSWNRGVRELLGYDEESAGGLRWEMQRSGSMRLLRYWNSDTTGESPNVPSGAH